ncbi:MAG: SOS response-associated peptidase [Eubacteriales bacterium]|jgi:putative SOS response-associated peptidase YedK
MCGRYTANLDYDEEIRSIYTATAVAFPGVKQNSGEIFPTNTVPVLRGVSGGIAPVPAVWGYPKYTGKGVIINARAETAADKYTFRDSLLSRRCVIPTTGYIEWSADKTKYRFNLPGQTLLYLAGFFKQFEDGSRFVILTTAPNESTKQVHNRMPVILPKDYITRWTWDLSWAMNYLNNVMPELIKTVI